MPRSLWTEPGDESEEVDVSSAEFPYIVIDFNILYDSKGVMVDRLWMVENLWQNFNVVVWREPKLFKYKINKVESDIRNHYDFDMVKILECSVDRLRKYLTFYRTIIITDDSKIGKILGWRAVNNFDYSRLLIDFPYLSRRKGQGI